MKLTRTGLILKSAALSVGILTASSGVAAVSYTHLTLPTKA